MADTLVTDETEKTTLDGSDELFINDVENGNVDKKVKASTVFQGGWEEATLSSPATSLTLTLSATAVEVECSFDAECASVANVLGRLNGISTTSYTWAQMQNTGASSNVAGAQSDTDFEIMDTGAANRPVTGKIWIRHGMDQVHINWIVVYSTGDASGVVSSHYGGAVFDSDVDITSITLLPTTGNLKTGTTLRGKIVEAA